MASVPLQTQPEPLAAAPRGRGWSPRFKQRVAFTSFFERYPEFPSYKERWFICTAQTRSCKELNFGAEKKELS